MEDLRPGSERLQRAGFGFRRNKLPVYVHLSEMSSNQNKKS